MTEKLLLQNTVTCLCPDKRRKYGCIICGDDADFLLLNDKSFCHTHTLERIGKAFEDGESAVLVTGTVGTGKTRILRQFAYDIRKKHSAVIFTRFDKDRYLFGKAQAEGDDSIFVKNSLARVFSQVLDYAGKHSLCSFSAQTPQQLLSELSDRDAVIIIDGVDTEQIPEYVYTLANMGFKVLISSDTAPKYDKSRICEIHHTPNVPCISQSTEYKRLCTLLNNNPHALFLAHCFMKEFRLDEKSMADWIKTVDVGGSMFYLELFYRLAGFSKEENEVLMTLSALMQYGIEDIRVFKKQSCIYTNRTGTVLSGTLGAKASRLIRLGFVKRLSDGSLYMNKSVIRFVIDEQKPDARSCPHLMRCISRFSDGVRSKKKGDGGNNKNDKSNREQDKPLPSASLLDVYVRFAESDKKYKKRIYNLVTAYIASKNSKQPRNDACGSLLLYNKSYAAFLFKQAVSGAYRRYMYSKNTTDGKTKYPYTPKICALLDITKICISFIRFSHTEGMDDCSYIYRLLEDTFDKILEVIKTGNFSVQYRLQVLAREIEMCSGVFTNVNNFSAFGVYTDDGGINILQDESTFSLYRSFGRLSRELLDTYESIPYRNAPRRFGKVRKSTKLFLTQLALFFNRLTRGFDDFFDFYSFKQKSFDFEKAMREITDDELSALLEKARFFAEYGFDAGNTKSKREYAGKIVSVLEKCRNPLLLSFLVTDASFPVSEQCRNSLVRLDFIGALTHNRRMGKELFSKLYVHCAFQLAENVWHTPFYAYALDRIFRLFPIDGDCFEEAAEYICCSFIRQACLCLEKYFVRGRHTSYGKDKLRDIAMCDTFKLIKTHTVCCYSGSAACRCIAGAVVTLCSKEGECYDSNTLRQAFLSLIYGRFAGDTTLSHKGLRVLIGMLCDENDAQRLYCEIEEQNSSKAIKTRIQEMTKNTKNTKSTKKHERTV